MCVFPYLPHYNCGEKRNCWCKEKAVFNSETWTGIKFSDSGISGRTYPLLPFFFSVRIHEGNSS